jgi:putative ABC transport system permease protein
MPEAQDTEYDDSLRSVALSHLKAIADRLESEYPDTNTGFGATAVSLREQLVGDVRPALLLLLGAVGFVLLIACANVANLLLARAAGREGEISLRLALGADSGKLIAMVLRQYMGLTVVGLVLGLAVAFAASRTLSGLLYGIEATDPVTFTAVPGLLAGVAMIASLLPARRATRVDPSVALRQE